METKHTKGEWFYRRGQIFSTVTSQLKKPNKICNIFAGYMGDVEEINANAKLITAAPDLLESLNDFYQLICEGHVKVYAEEGVNIQKYYSQIESAIEKATK